MIIIRFSQHCN